MDDTETRSAATPDTKLVRVVSVLEGVFFVTGFAGVLLLMAAAISPERPYLIHLPVIYVLSLLAFLPYIGVALLLRKLQKGKTEGARADFSRIYALGTLLTFAALSAYLIYGKLENYAVANPAVEIQDARYTSGITNTELMIPEGWTYIPEDAELTLPANYVRDGFAAEKTGTACVIAQVSVQNRNYQGHRQSSFGTRVFSPFYQFDSDWWIASTTENAHYAFSWDEGRQRIPGEYRTASGFRENTLFILFSKDGAAVPDECDSDLNELVKTVVPYYEPITLTPAMRGELRLNRIFDAHIPEGEKDEGYEHILFKEDNTDEWKEVMRLPEGVTWTNDFFVYKNKLYVESNIWDLDNYQAPPTSSLYVIDPSRAEAAQIPGSQGTGPITSMLIEGERLYYMVDVTSSTCLDSYRPCPSQIYSIPISGGAPAHVADTELGGNILGFVPSEQAFYIRRSWGDAGCVSHKFSRIVSGQEERIGDFGDCYDEGNNAAYEQMVAEVKALSARATAGQTISSTLLYEFGRLMPGKDREDSYTLFHFR